MRFNVLWHIKTREKCCLSGKLEDLHPFVGDKAYKYSIKDSCVTRGQPAMAVIWSAIYFRPKVLSKYAKNRLAEGAVPRTLYSFE